jgi:hypothetical protein
MFTGSETLLTREVFSDGLFTHCAYDWDEQKSMINKNIPGK